MIAAVIAITKKGLFVGTTLKAVHDNQYRAHVGMNLLLTVNQYIQNATKVWHKN